MNDSSLPVTPVVLTKDEEPNLARTLEGLHWADRVLVVDSGSTDATERIARSYPNVSFVVHPFEDFGSQWRFATSLPALATPYVLALDADMVVTPAFVQEMRARFFDRGFVGGRVRFRYVVGGRSLLGSLYPPDLRLFHRDHVSIGARGHRHLLDVSGPIHRFRARLLHDDRKPVERFLRSQIGYAVSEARRITEGTRLRFRDRVRRTGLMAPAMFVLAWVRAGAVLRGRASMRYAHERALYEAMLALLLMEDRAAWSVGRSIRGTS